MLLFLQILETFPGLPQPTTISLSSESWSDSQFRSPMACSLVRVFTLFHVQPATPLRPSVTWFLFAQMTVWPPLSSGCFSHMGLLSCLPVLHACSCPIAMHSLPSALRSWHDWQFLFMEPPTHKSSPYSWPPFFFCLILLACSWLTMLC